MNWDECLIKYAKSIKVDHELIDSLIKSSKNKMTDSDKLEIDHIVASSKVSLAYESLRERLEAIAIFHGYKIYNHECFSSFINEILKEKDIANEFDRIRRIRNKINYYGKELDIKEALLIIKDIKNIIFLLVH